MFLLVRFLVSLPFLCVASYHDLKFREVPNRVWSVFIGCAVPLLLLDGAWPSKILAISAVWGLAVFFFYVAGLGGADAKALMCLSVAFPDLLLLSFGILTACSLAMATGILYKKVRNNLPFVAFLTVGFMIVFFFSLGGTSLL